MGEPRIPIIGGGPRRAPVSQDVLDARNRPLQEGDEIILNLASPVYFRVAQITPVLDPNAPPGHMFVHVGAVLTFTAKLGEINRQFIRVRTAEEAGPPQFQMLDAQPDQGGRGEGKKD